jgi:5-methylcytosine-specific restriction endonuclease McrA
MVLAVCEWCNKEQKVTPSRASTYRFCSYACRGEWRKVNWTGENSPFWQGGERSKVCQHCNGHFSIRPGQPITTFKVQKFCSHECGVEGRNTSGEANPNWKGGHSNRSNRQSKWARLVISRDMATCQECGITGVELHAHHIQSFKDNPSLRWDVSNGKTLCFKCHWAVHSAVNENVVNSGKPLTVGAEGNPEPSLDGNISEGVTTRGRAYRRWNGNCPTCGTFISKRLSDVTGKSYVACSRSCATKHAQKIRRSRQ